MIVAIKPYYDATLYEAYPDKNTGLDEILEIQKTISGSSYAESRPILYFNTQDITRVLADNAVSASQISCSLIMNTVQMSEVPLAYNIQVLAVSGSWTNGTGKFADTELSGGVTWAYRAGESDILWRTSSFTAGSTGSYNVYPGGGNWYTGSVVSQSFSFKQNNDLSVNVTSIVKSWLTGSIYNDGLLVKLDNVNAADILTPTNIQFYSSDTHTVYGPSLFIQWDNSVFATGSLSPATVNDIPVVYLHGFRGEFKPNVTTRCFVRSRPMYPRKTFTQNSSYITVLYLPETSYYRILDAHTNEVIIDYSEFTQLSCDSNGNYFDFSTTPLYPERFYKLEFKVEFTGSIMYYDNDFIFKIVN